MSILTRIRDPRVSGVTVTYVEVSGDLREAKVHVSVMGDAKKQELCMHGLRSSTGFLQQKVAERVDTRYTPRLKFVLDEGVKKSAEVSRILGELLPEESVGETGSQDRPKDSDSGAEAIDSQIVAPGSDGKETEAVDSLDENNEH